MDISVWKLCICATESGPIGPGRRKGPLRDSIARTADWGIFKTARRAIGASFLTLQEP